MSYVPLQILLASPASQPLAACLASVTAMAYQFYACLLSLAIYGLQLPDNSKLLHLLPLVDLDKTLHYWA